MKSHLTIATALIILLTGCGSSGSSSTAPTTESAEDRNLAIASCGVMGKMISGEMPINADTYLEVENTLEGLAENAPGEVKTTAQFVLDGLEGKEHSDSESKEQIEKFKDYCMNYTID